MDDETKMRLSKYPQWTRVHYVRTLYGVPPDGVRFWQTSVNLSRWGARSHSSILLEAQGIKILVPKETDRVVVNAVIYNELCQGKITDESRARYKRIIADLIEQGANGIILGCTEIGLLVKAEDSTVSLFDTTLLHAKGAVNLALG